MENNINFLTFCHRKIFILIYIKYYNSDGENTLGEMEMAVSSSHQENRIGKVLLCFSIYTNTKTIFSTKMDDSITIIHGMKFLGMVWIIMAHTALYTMDYLGK